MDIYRRWQECFSTTRKAAANLDFLISDEGRKIIAEFGAKQFGEPIYYPTAIKNPK